MPKRKLLQLKRKPCTRKRDKAKEQKTLKTMKMMILRMTGHLGHFNCIAGKHWLPSNRGKD